MSGCRECPAFAKCTVTYRGSACAALRFTYGLDSDPEAIKTNADHIRSMSDEELANLLCTADWCETCDQMREEGTCKAMELDGPLNKHCVSAALRWLRQPYKEEA